MLPTYLFRRIPDAESLSLPPFKHTYTRTHVHSHTHTYTHIHTNTHIYTQLAAAVAVDLFLSEIRREAAMQTVDFFVVDRNGTSVDLT